MDSNTPTGSFGYQALSDAIETERIARGLNQTQLVKSIDWVGFGVLNRLKEGHATTCQHVIGLLLWLRRSPESFMPGVEDRPEYALPETDGSALRWSMPALSEAIDACRIERGLTWQQVATELDWSAVKGFDKKIKYGIPMHLAMRITRWLDKPAVTYLYRC